MKEYGNLCSEEKSVVVSVSLLQSHNGFRVPWKQCLICDREGDRGLGAILLGVWFHMGYEY